MGFIVVDWSAELLMKYNTYERIMASIVVFIVTLGAMIIGIGALLMMVEYGFFQVAVGIMTLILLFRFSWTMGKVVLDHGDKD